MAVIDPDQVAVGVVGPEDGISQLRRIDLVARLGRGVDVPPANDAIDDFAVPEQQATAFARGRLARVGDDLIAQAPREDDPGPLAQRPPAIAGMTMTSLPSGTDAPLPPRLRASSSPM